MRAGDETLLLCRTPAILHEAASLHTIKTARRSIIFVVPLEIELAIGVGPETGAGCIAPEIVRIAFHGAVEPAYHAATATILCRRLASGLNSRRPVPRLMQASLKNRTSKV